MKKILFLLLFISTYSSPTHASTSVEDEGGLFTGSDKVSGKIFNESCWVAIVGVRQEHLMRLHSLPCQQIIS